MKRGSLRNLAALPTAVGAVLVLFPALVALPGAVRGVTGFGNWLGWLGAGLIGASLLLMVREPGVAARFGGLERMYRWHHALGTLGYGALVAHPLVLAGAVFPGQASAAWRLLSPLAQSGAGMLGWLSLLGLMVGLGTTFAVRLRYSLWRPLHGVLAVAVLLGIAHVLAIDGFGVPVLLLTVPALLALGWRVLRADAGGGARPYEVNRVARPAHGVVEAQLKPLATPIPVTPGQFVMAAFFEGPSYHGCGEYHPYTVSGVAADGTLGLSIKALGDCTGKIQSLSPGVASRVQGPYGTFLVDRPQAPELWVAAGIGVTPFLAVLRAGPLANPTEFIYVYRQCADAPYAEELRGCLRNQAPLRFHPLALGDDPTALLALLSNLEDLTVRQIYLCGPPALIDVLRGWLRERGVAAARIHFERFDFR